MTAARSSTTSTRPSSASPRLRLSSHGAALAAIVLLAAALRLPTLGLQSVWFDEAATWDLVRLPFGEMLSAIPERESTPPLFYVGEWVWTRVVGDGEVGLRSLPALAGILTVPVAYAIARRPAGPRAGLATAALVATNPLLVWFSQEARAYALVVLLSAAALLLLLRALDDPRPRALAAWALAAAAALATHWFAAFVLLGQALWLLWRHPRRGAAAAAVAGVGAVGLALLPILLDQRGNPYDIGGEPLLVRLVQVPKQLLLGYRGPAMLALGLLAAGLVALAAWLLLRRGERAARERALAMAGLGAVGVALPALAALAGADYLNARNVIPALVPLLVALGIGFGAARGRRGGTAGLVALCAVSVAIVVGVAAEREYQRPDWAGLAAALGVAEAPRAVVISPANGEAALRFYRRGLRPMAAAGAAVREVVVVAVAAAPDPNDEPELPGLVGERPGAAGFGAPEEVVTETYRLLRYRAAAPVRVTPITAATARFSERYPSVDVLPAGR